MAGFPAIAAIQALGRGAKGASDAIGSVYTPILPPAPVAAPSPRQVGVTDPSIENAIMDEKNRQLVAMFKQRQQGEVAPPVVSSPDNLNKMRVV